MLPFMSEVMAEATSVLKVLKIKPTDKEQQVDYLKVDVGFVAQQMLKEKSSKLSERQLLQFRVECKDFLAGTVAKLLDKTPINYRLVRSISCLDPRLMASEKEAYVTKMKQILEILVEAHILKCDEVMYQFGQFLDYCADESDFDDFDPSEPTSNCCMNTWQVISNWLKCGMPLNYCCLCLIVKPQLKEAFL